MSACLMAGTLALTLAGDSFVLEWTHSVEKTAWRENWAIREGGLLLTGAAVKGSGAGMEPGPGAVLKDGWWVWRPDLPPQPRLTLAASGATGGGWRLCAAGLPGGDCVELGAAAGQPVTLRPCPGKG
ncbi:MAG: DUF1850 domain-containing protein [Paracoccus sp. (in: a-proteobacteria)]